MNDNISVSEERLRLILAEFKLELFERLGRDLATKAEVAAVEALKVEVRDLARRIVTLEDFAEVERDVKELKAAAADASAVSRYKRAVYVAIVAAVGAVGGAIGYAMQSL